VKIIKKIVAFIRSFFKTKAPEQPKKARKKRIYKGKTIKKTLDNLDAHFERLYIKREVKGWSGSADWNTLRALRKMGPFVPQPGYQVESDKIEHEKRPTMMFFANDPSFQMDEDDNIAFVYAIKLPTRNQWFLEAHNKEHPVYEIGIGFQCGHTEGKLYWGTYDVQIIDNQAVPLKRLYGHQVSLPNGEGYVSRNWRLSTFGSDNNIEGVKYYAHSVFNFWQAKNEMWHVICKKDGKRMTFCVPKKDTKHYFKDRENVVEDGVSKKIIHHVRAHDRKTGGGSSHVREHIRGLRQFKWNGYGINVKTPMIGNELIFDEFNVDPTWKTNKTITTAEAVTRLVGFDDAPQINLTELKKETA